MNQSIWYKTGVNWYDQVVRGFLTRLLDQSFCNTGKRWD
jgi:hypothetical protein